MSIIRHIGRGIELRYEPVGFVSKFDGKQIGKTLERLLEELTSKDAEQRTDYMIIMQDFLDVRLIALPHVWYTNADQLLNYLAENRKSQGFAEFTKDFAKALEVSVEKAEQIVTFANPYIKEAELFN